MTKQSSREFGSGAMTTEYSMGMVQLHAFPCNNVLYGANKVIFLSVQFISHWIQLFFKDEISVFKNGNNKVAFIFLNSSPLRKYYLLIILQ